MNFIQDYFKHLWNIPNLNSPIPSIPLEGGAFPAYLEVDISGNEFEVPTPLVPYVPIAKGSGCTKLVFSLVHGANSMGIRTFHKKTITTILRQFAMASVDDTRIAHVITSKGVHYYGCKGMFFSEDYEPLLLSTVTVLFNPEDGIINLTNPKCRISYRVFERASELVEKTIIKQAIPFYSNFAVDIKYRGDYYGSNIPVRLSIEHMNSMIVKPCAPTPSSADMRNFNNSIVTYYETQ